MRMMMITMMLMLAINNSPRFNKRGEPLEMRMMMIIMMLMLAITKQFSQVQ